MNLFFQPIQQKLFDEILYGKATTIGFYGGRGCGKSLCFDMIIIAMMVEANAKNKPISICCAMQNHDQILKYHINEILSKFPELEKNMKKTSPGVLTIGKSKCVFDYGDSDQTIERRFRSGNYDFIFVDQTELFDESEIRELSKTIRSAAGYNAKLILSFNMRGAGIKWLRKWFHDNELPNPEDYTSIKINPWDNVFWVLDALIEDKLTIKDYFRWTDDQRKEYAARRGQYTKKLANDPEATRAADWDGSWDAVEGAYFGDVFDLEKTRINHNQTFALMKDWATHWISQDWGRGHYTASYWHFRVSLSPSEVNKILGWQVVEPLNVVVTYRESILNGQESNEIAQRLVDLTPTSERKKMRSFYIGKDAFDVTDSKNTIAMNQSVIMKANGMPGAIRADWSRVGGWSLMSQLLKATKNKGFVRDIENNLKPAKDVWLISTECAQLLQSIPNAMRDEDDIDDVQKTDKSKADIDMDALDGCRYGLKSMLAPKKKSVEDEFKEAFAAATPEQQMLMSFRKFKEQESRNNAPKKNLGSWRNRL